MSRETCPRSPQDTDGIRDLEIALYRLETRRTEVEERLKEISKRAARIIEEKYLAEKSPELSNAQKRADATDALVRSNTEAQRLEHERGSLDIEIRIGQIDLSYERRKWRREYADDLLTAAGLPPRRRSE